MQLLHKCTQQDDIISSEEAIETAVRTFYSHFRTCLEMLLRAALLLAIKTVPIYGIPIQNMKVYDIFPFPE